MVWAAHLPPWLLVVNETGNASRTCLTWSCGGWISDGCYSHTWKSSGSSFVKNWKLREAGATQVTSWDRNFQRIGLQVSAGWSASSSISKMSPTKFEVSNPKDACESPPHFHANTMATKTRTKHMYDAANSHRRAVGHATRHGSPCTSQKPLTTSLPCNCQRHIQTS